MVQDFEAKLNEYAHLLVEVGLNVQPGQTPSIESNIEYADLTRLCVSACYDCGARNVVAYYGDDFLTRESFLRADEAVFSEYPSYMKARIDWFLEQKSPRLSFTGSGFEPVKDSRG
ncbi:MAG: aminopeptidase, partial [Clostridiales bacterium]|nr:aminopeptidase [Clostridiales bacterium]